MKHPLLFQLLLLAACSPSRAPSDGPLPDAGAPQGAPCQLTSDCADELLLCGYPIDAGCAAQGICVPEDLSCMNDGPAVCSCDGITPVGLACIYGPGYAPLPVPGTTPGCTQEFDASLD